jgi:hypothetical protein
VWPHPGRRGMSFVVERDIHLGSLEALALPPGLRVGLEGVRRAHAIPARVTFVEPRLIELA